MCTDMAEQPRCDWPVMLEGKSSPCNSPRQLYRVQGRGKLTGNPRTTFVCLEHLPLAWGSWNVEAAEPLAQKVENIQGVIL